MKIIIPMAGNGSRFVKLGFSVPKPMIPVVSFNNNPMVKVALDNIGIDADKIFIVQKEHCVRHNLKERLFSEFGSCTIIETDGVTEGAACTVLLTKELINNDESILIVNSDQFIEWNRGEFIKFINTDIDGAILSFKSSNPNCSYVRLDNDGYVVEAKEKKQISDIATVGVYYWKRGSDFVKYAEQMISKNIRTNNEFYICPVYQEAVDDGKKVKTFDISKYWSLGTPEDLDCFVKNFKP